MNREMILPSIPSILAAAMLLIPVMAVGAQPVFVEDGASRGICAMQALYGKGFGVSAADYDDDGDIDLFVPNDYGVADQLYRNDGNGQFEEIAAAVGLAGTGRSRTSLWFDYTGDGRLDLIIAGDCQDVGASSCLDEPTLTLYQQSEDGTFVLKTAAAGISGITVSRNDKSRGGIAAADLNNDGYLDVVTGLWDGPAHLLINNGDGTFSDGSDTAGLTTRSNYWQPMLHDFNGDGWMDIYYAIDFNDNLMLINQGNGQFLDKAVSSGTNNAWNDMGLSLGDYDGDGDFDIYVTNIYRASGRGNLLLRNDSSSNNLSFSRHSVGWFSHCNPDPRGSRPCDPDVPEGAGGVPGDQSKLFVNDGSGIFFDQSTAAGFDDRYWGSSLIAVDIDRDGDLDLVQTCNGSGMSSCTGESPLASTLRVLRNDLTTSDHYLVVKPRASGPNARAIGAVVRIETDAGEQSRLITAGTSFLGQEPAEAHFGLGEATQVNSIVVEWPDGFVSTLGATAADQVIQINSPRLFHDGFE
jgi:hypothetical protein